MRRHPENTRRDPIPPRRTGRADFPHPALAATLIPGHARRTGMRRLARGPATVSKKTQARPPRACRRGTPGVQADVPSSDHHVLPLRPLRSAVVTRFLATMSRSDSRPQPPARLCLPVRRWALPTHCAGSPRFLGRSVPARCPLSPRKARRLPSPVTSPSAAGFSISGRLATFIKCNEADAGSLALRLAGSLPGASPAGLLRPTSGSLPVERAIDRVTSFHVTRSTRLVLAHQRAQRELFQRLVRCPYCLMSPSVFFLGVLCASVVGPSYTRVSISYAKLNGAGASPPRGLCASAPLR
jgi:hypothetical protein